MAAAAGFLVPWWPMALVFALVAALSAMVVWGGGLCLRRNTEETRPTTGRGAGSNHNTATAGRNPRKKSLAIGRSLRLRLLGLRVGDEVEVRSAEEILATLDDQASLDALPFMPEMLRYCGQRFHVFRRGDKIFDTQLNTWLRRLQGVVLLDGLRCDGSGHGGCQAGCQFLWKEAWLRPLTPAAASSLPRGRPIVSGPNSDIGTRVARGARLDGERFRCQLTELPVATTPMAWWDVRQDLRALVSGNVGLVQWLNNIAIRLFNTVQRLRGGVTYPYLEESTSRSSPEYVSNLQPGELVEVRTRQEITNTLDRRQRNRGLWFDIDMLPHCGKRYRVLRRVEQIVDERTGKMLHLRNPCIVLDGVTTTHEWHRFCPQNEYSFWREIWLRRVDEAESHGAPGSRSTTVGEDTLPLSSLSDRRSR